MGSSSSNAMDPFSIYFLVNRPSASAYCTFFVPIETNLLSGNADKGRKEAALYGTSCFLFLRIIFAYALGGARLGSGIYIRCYHSCYKCTYHKYVLENLRS